LAYPDITIFAYVFQFQVLRA